MPTSLVTGCNLFIYLFICTGTSYLYCLFKQSPGALPIQKIVWFEILEIPRAQWNGTFRLHRPDPSHRDFGYCSCKQDTNEPYWGQQFCEMERDGPTDLKWADGSNIPVAPNQNGPFLLISNRISGLLGWMENAPVKVDYTSSWSVFLTRGLLPYISYIGMCGLIGPLFALFWSENGYILCPFWSGIGYGFRGYYRSVWTYLSFQFQINKKEKNTRMRNAFEEFFCLHIESKELWRNFCLKTRSENGYGFWRSGMKTGL